MKKWIILTVIALTNIAGFFIYCAVFTSSTAFNEKEVVVYIPTRADFGDVLHRLHPLLKSGLAFEQVAKQRGYTTHVKAGKYIIKKGASNLEIIRTLRNRNTPVKLKPNDQEQLEDLATRIAEQIEPDSTTLICAFLDPTLLKENGFIEATALAMYLPDTYEFHWNTTAEEFRDRMLKEYHRYWIKERQAQVRVQGLSPIEVSILASIVQEESAKVGGRPRIAGVYLNRLHINMLLQVDPTAIFAMENHTDNYNMVIKRVTEAYTRLENLHDTYQNYGLPIGLIVMPDLPSIEAVLKPEQHGYYFFVADPQNYDYHKFPRTFLQHTESAKKCWNWANEQGIKQ